MLLMGSLNQIFYYYRKIKTITSEHIDTGINFYCHKMPYGQKQYKYNMCELMCKTKASHDSKEFQITRRR